MAKAISNLSRRTILAGAAATFPAAAVPAFAMPGEADPIIAAIHAYRPLAEESKAAWEAYIKAADAIAPLPAFDEDAPELWRKECNRRCRLVRDAPHMREIEKRSEDSCNRASEAAEVVFNTMPTTLPGLFLLLKELARQQDENTNDIVGDRWDEYLPRLAKAAAAFARRARVMGRKSDDTIHDHRLKQVAGQIVSVLPADPTDRAIVLALVNSFCESPLPKQQS